jgi:hypothetical protein
MTKNLRRRIEKLERIFRPVLETKLRAYARMHRYSEEKFLRAVKGHERELTEGMGSEGSYTWATFELVYPLLERAGLLRGDEEQVTWEEFQNMYVRRQLECHDSPAPVAPGTPPGGEQR